MFRKFYLKLIVLVFFALCLLIGGVSFALEGDVPVDVEKVDQLDIEEQGLKLIEQSPEKNPESFYFFEKKGEIKEQVLEITDSQQIELALPADADGKEYQINPETIKAVKKHNPEKSFFKKLFSSLKSPLAYAFGPVKIEMNIQGKAKVINPEKVEIGDRLVLDYEYGRFDKKFEIEEIGLPEPDALPEPEPEELFEAPEIIQTMPPVFVPEPEIYNASSTPEIDNASSTQPTSFWQKFNPFAWLKKTNAQEPLSYRIKLKSGTQAGVQTFAIKPDASLELYDGEQIAAVSKPRFEYLQEHALFADGQTTLPNLDDSNQQWLAYQHTNIKTEKQIFADYAKIIQHIETSEGDPITFEYNIGFDGKDYIKKQTWSIESEREVRAVWDITKFSIFNFQFSNKSQIPNSKSQTENLFIDFSDFQGNFEVAEDSENNLKIYFYDKFIDPAIYLAFNETKINIKGDDFEIEFDRDRGGMSDDLFDFTLTNATTTTHLYQATNVGQGVSDYNSIRAKLHYNGKLDSQVDYDLYYTVNSKGKIYTQLNLINNSEANTYSLALNNATSTTLTYSQSLPLELAPSASATAMFLQESQSSSENDYLNPSALEFTIGSRTNDGFDEQEGNYTMVSAGERLAFQISGNIYNRHYPVFKIGDWHLDLIPQFIKLNVVTLTEGADYRVDFLNRDPETDTLIFQYFGIISQANAQFELSTTMPPKQENALQTIEHSPKTDPCDFYLNCTDPWIQGARPNNDIYVRLKSATISGYQDFEFSNSASGVSLYDGENKVINKIAPNPHWFEEEQERNYQLLYNAPESQSWTAAENAQGLQMQRIIKSKKTGQDYELLTETWQFFNDLSKPKISYDMTGEDGVEPWVFDLELTGISAITQDQDDIQECDPDCYPAQDRKWQDINFNLTDFISFGGQNYKISEWANGNKAIIRFFETPTTGARTVDPKLWVSQTSTTITVQTGGLTTSDFKLVFNTADAGISEGYKGTGAAWSANYLSATELLTELDQDTDLQVDKTSTLALLENTLSRVIIKNKFFLGSEADATEYWHIYPDGKLHKYIKYVKNLTGVEARAVDDGAVDFVATGMSGYHPSAPATDRAVATYWDAQLINIINTATAEITDYQTPGAPSMTTGTLLSTATTNAFGDDDADGFNEGMSGYEIRGAASGTYRADFTLDGSTTNRYKPIFNFHEFYPTTGSAQTAHTLTHLRLDNSAANQGTGGAGTLTGATYSSTIKKRGYSALFDADGENIALNNTTAIDENEGTIEFWYQSLDDYDAGATVKRFFGNYDGTQTTNYLYLEENASNNLVFHYLDNAGLDHTATVSLATELPYKANEWNHFKVVWDIDAGNGNLQINLNGLETDEVYANDGSFTVGTFANYFYVGDYMAAGTTEANGYIDEFYIFDENVLTATDLNQPIIKKDGAVLTETTNYNISRTPETSSYIIQYLSNVTTNAQFQFAQGLSTNVQTWTKSSFSDSADYLKDIRLNNSNDAMVAFNEFEQDASTVGLWHMNESSEAVNEGGQTVIDYSGFTNNGSRGADTGTDPKWTIDRDAKLGDSGLYFDGTDDYVKVPDNAGLEFGDTQDFTLEAWFRVPSGTNQVQNILIKYDADSSYFLQVQDTANSCNLWFQIEGITTATTVTSVAAENYCDGKYHHVAAVLDADTSTYLYVDGVLKDSDPDTTSGAIGSNAADLNFGYYAGGATQPVRGSIDEIRIWNDIRTLAEIQDNKYYEIDSSDSSLVAYYKMDAGGQTVTDAKATYNGTLGADDTVTANDPKYLGHGMRYDNNESDPALADLNYALNFDGTDDYVSIASVSPGLAEAPMTISFWSFKTATQATAYRISLDYSLNVYGGIAVRGDYFLIQTAAGTSKNVLITEPSNNIWHQQVFVKDANKDIRIYLDGVLVASDSHTLTGTLVNNVGGFIGVRHKTGGIDSPFAGRIDDVRIYNTALSATDVADLFSNPAYNSYTANLVGHWKFNDPQTRTNDLDVALDSSSSGNTGTLGADTSDASDDPTWKIATDGPAASDGYLDGGLSFDGTDDYCVLGNVSNSVKTIELWTKLTSTTEQILDLNATKYLEAVSGVLDLVGDTGETIYVDGSATTAIDTNWHYVAVTTPTAINASAANIAKISTNYGQAIIDELRLSSTERSIANIPRFKSSGTIASEVKDSTAAGTVWQEINWNAITTGDYEGSISQLEVRASDTSFTKYASTPAWTAVYANPISPISSGLPTGQYMQWRFTMTPKSDTNKTESPILQDVNVKYYTTAPPTEPETVYSIANGNWSATGTWDTGIVPTSTQKVYIKHAVTLNQDASVKNITIDSGGKLNFDTTARTLTINETAGAGLITVGAAATAGELECRAPTTGVHTIKLNSTTADAAVGIQVESMGELDIQGTSASDQDCIITNGGVTLDGTRDGYIYLKDGSLTTIKFAEISYMGANAANKYGIYANAVDGNTASEGVFIQGSKIHNNYDGIQLDTSTYNLIDSNSVYSNTNNGILITNTSTHNTLSNNSVYSNTNSGIALNSDTADNNAVLGNISHSNTVYGIYVNDGDANYIYNNTINSNSDDGIFLVAGSTSNIIKNNLIANTAASKEGIDDDGTTTTISNNYFYNNGTSGTAHCTNSGVACAAGASSGGGSGTPNSTVGTAPGYISTDPTNADFLYLDSNETVANGPLGIGLELWGASPTVPGYINVGARLGYVKNITDDEEFNWLQDAHDDATSKTLGAGDTVTAYAKNYVSDTITAVTAVGSYFVQLSVAEATVLADNDHEGMYAYFTSGTNQGKYYLIIDSDENTTDTLTIYSSTDASTTFTAGDGFTIVDRVYDRASGRSGGSENLYLTKDGTSDTNRITWNTSGTVIADAKSQRNDVIYMYGASYNTIQGFVLLNSIGQQSYHANIYMCNSNYNNIFYNTVAYGQVTGIDLGSYSHVSSANTISFNDIFNNRLYGIAGGTGVNIVSNNNVFGHNYYSSSYGVAGSLILNNNIYNNRVGISGRSNSLVMGNNIFNSSNGSQGAVYFSGGQQYATFIGNNFFGNRGGEKGTIYFNAYGSGAGVSYNYFYNNNFIGSSDGILINRSDQIGNVIRNNVFAYHTDDGLDNDGASTVHEYNHYYSNARDYEEGASAGTFGTGEAVSNPNFYIETSSASNAISSATVSTLTIGSSAWTANAYQYMGLRVYGATCAMSGSTANGKWFGITRNTANTLYVAPNFDSATYANCSYEITNFYVQEDSPALAAGADLVSGSQPAMPQINIGARLGYITNSASKYNFLQQAEDDDAYSAGDTLNIYGYEYIAAGTVGATLTDNGPYITIDVDDNALTASDQHEGMYMFMTSGTNSGKYYLIIDSVETTIDTISLYISATTGFAQNDTFKIIDRIYNKQSSNSANLSLGTSGTLGSEITWQPQGSVIISADSALDYVADWAYNIFGETAVNYVKIDKNITFYVPGSTSALGGETYETGTTHYCYQACAVPTALNQNYYRFYQNKDAIQPDTALANENTALDRNSETNTSDVFRIRMSVQVSNATSTAGSLTTKLQYAQSSDCSSGWTDLGGLADTDKVFRGYNNATPADGAAITGLLLTVSDTLETYEEANNSAANPNEIAVNNDGEWDWVVQNYNAPGGKHYCFRMVQSDNTVLDTYTNYPQLTTPEELTFSLDSYSVTFANLDPANSWTDTKTTITTTSTNASSGYLITAWATDVLTHTIAAANTIAHWTGTNTTPTDFSSGTGFGYTTDDTTLAGGTANRFSTGTLHAGFSTTPEEVADETTGPVSNSQHTITYKVSVTATQAAGPYSTTLIYICTPNY